MATTRSPRSRISVCSASISVCGAQLGRSGCVSGAHIRGRRVHVHGRGGRGDDVPGSRWRPCLVGGGSRRFEHVRWELLDIRGSGDQGVMRFRMTGTLGTVPVEQTMWMPSGCETRRRSGGPSFAPSAKPSKPPGCRVGNVALKQSGRGCCFAWKAGVPAWRLGLGAAAARRALRQR